MIGALDIFKHNHRLVKPKYMQKFTRITYNSDNFVTEIELSNQNLTRNIKNIFTATKYIVAITYHNNLFVVSPGNLSQQICLFQSAIATFFFFVAIGYCNKLFCCNSDDIVIVNSNVFATTLISSLKAIFIRKQLIQSFVSKHFHFKPIRFFVSKPKWIFREFPEEIIA